MTREIFQGILTAARQRHFKSIVFCCDFPGVRDAIADQLAGIVMQQGGGRIVDFSDVTPGLEPYEDFQLEIWRRTIVGAESLDGYLLIGDGKDMLAKWSPDTRHLAWRFLSRAAYCRGVLVVSSVEPQRIDEFRRMGCLQDDGDFDKIPYFQPAHDDAEEVWRQRVIAITG